MAKYREENKRQLGIDYGTAMHRLRKMVLFSLVQKVGLDECFQCHQKIETPAELSVEHKIPWRGRPEMFWDLTNIAFSHNVCNSNAGVATKIKNKIHPSYNAYRDGCRCPGCVSAARVRKRGYRHKNQIDLKLKP